MLSLYCICLRGSCRSKIVVWLWPASKRIFQSLLLKFELMRFQNMSAPCDNERAWRSWGTARDASWQNSDFNMDHKLEHKSTCVNWLKDCWAFFLTKETGWHIPGNEHLFLNVGQELGMIFAGQIQALSMETKDLQTVHHVEQNVWFLKLWHFLYTKRLCCNNRHCSFRPECEPALTQYLQNCVY